MDGVQSARNVTHPSTVSTPPQRVNKFNFKLKKSPENGQGNTLSSRPVLSSMLNTPHPEANKRISPVGTGAISANGKDILGRREPGGATTDASVSRGLRSPLVQAVQPPMGVTVKRDGTSVTSKPSQMTFNSQVNQGSATLNLRTLSAQQHGSNNSQSACKPTEQPTEREKVFQRYCPTSTDNTPPAPCTPMLRTSHSANQLRSSTNQLRNPSVSANVPTASFTALNKVSSASPSVHGTNPATSQTLRNNPGPGSNTSSNHPSFKRYQGPTNVQAHTSQTKNQPYGTPRTNPQYQARNVSPLHASTPGYHTPIGGPSPGSSRFQGVTTPIPPVGQPSRYPTTPRAGASTFNKTGGTPRMRDNQQVPLLTPRVAQLCQTPSGNGSRSAIRTRARKFPGPAGVLPKLVSY